MALCWCSSRIRVGCVHKSTTVIICAYGHLLMFCIAAWVLYAPPAFDLFKETETASAATAFLTRIIITSLVVGGLTATLFLRPANWGRPWDVTLAQGLARSVLCGTLIVLMSNVLIVLGSTQTGIATDMVTGHEVVRMPLMWISRPAVRGLALDAVAIKANARGWLRFALHATSWGITLANSLAQTQFSPLQWIRWSLSGLAIAAGTAHLVLVILCVKVIGGSNDRRWAIALTILYGSGLIFLTVTDRGSIGTFHVAAIASCCFDAMSVLALSAFINTLHWLTESDTQRQLATTQAAFEQQRKFLSYICHELRVPLQSIVLAAEDAYESAASASHEHQSAASTDKRGGNSVAITNHNHGVPYNPLRIILTATEALSKLVDDFLSLSKIEAGKLVMEVGPFDPRALIHDVLSQCMSQLRRGQLTVTLELDSDVPLLAVSDAGRLRQILNNFTTNAMKFTPPGGSLVYRLRMVPVDRLVGVQFAAAFLPLHSPVTTTRHASPAFGGQSISTDDHPTTAFSCDRLHEDGDCHVAAQTSFPFHLEIDASSSEVDVTRTDVPPLSTGVDTKQGVATPRFTKHPHPPSVIVPVVSTILAAGVGSTVDRTSPRNWQAGWNGPLAAPVPCMLVFEVQDSGVGIDVVDQEKLFRPFEQIKAGALQKGNGTGLGLSICKHIIQQLGGDIGCASSEGHGSRFWFSIPVVGVPPAVSSVPTPLSRGVRTSLRSTTGAELLSMPARESLESVDLSADSAPTFRGAPPRKAAAVQELAKLEVSQYSRRPPVPAITNHAALVIKCPSVALSAVPELISDLTPIARPPQLNSPPGQISAGSPPSSPVSPVMHPPAMIQKATGTMHAVVVDDTDVNRIMLARLLQRVGFGKVSTAIHGADALSQPELLSADVWLVDRNMPVMGGEELTVALRTRGYGGIIIGVSGDAIGEVGEGWKRAGLTCLLLKPVSRIDVEATLRAHGVL